MEDLIETVHRGAVRRIRPMARIGSVDVLGLVPVMLATGIGADVMKRIAAPQVCGVLFGDDPHARGHSADLRDVALVEDQGRGARVQGGADDLMGHEPAVVLAGVGWLPPASECPRRSSR